MDKNQNNKKLTIIIIVLISIIFILLVAFAFLLGRMSGQKNISQTTTEMTTENNTTENSTEKTAYTEATTQAATEVSIAATKAEHSTDNLSQSFDEYNIGSNLECRLTDGLGLVQSDYFSLVLPYNDFANGLWEVGQDDNSSISFYYSKAKENGYGGWVFTIKAYDWGDNSYSDFPDYKIADTTSDKKYIIILPTDVQYDYTDSTQQEEYGRMLQFANTIDQNNESSSFAAAK